MRIAVILAAFAGFMYLLYESSKKTSLLGAKPLLVTPSTPINYAAGVPAFFASPSPVKVDSKQKIAGYGNTDGLYPLTPVSPSLVQQITGYPLVAPSGVSDINGGVDYPGVQSYMHGTVAVDPNSINV